ncbi:hypothetical protein [Mycoplasmopsis cricetuli]|uniref:hypothetical protein n=1 Tax=Mycoplasmopsis cricetuli TaxID=171283 RepID=UPI00046F3858|nr:hypothetical protein [Mycoplasmopsis cricetuli]
MKKNFKLLFSVLAATVTMSGIATACTQKNEVINPTPIQKPETKEINKDENQENLAREATVVSRMLKQTVENLSLVLSVEGKDKKAEDANYKDVFVVLPPKFLQFYNLAEKNISLVSKNEYSAIFEIKVSTKLSTGTTITESKIQEVFGYKNLEKIEFVNNMMNQAKEIDKQIEELKKLLTDVTDEAELEKILSELDEILKLINELKKLEKQFI